MNNKCLLCPNCGEGYSLTNITPPMKNRLPLNLECGHSICEECIVNIVTFDTPYDCKICHKTTEIAPNDGKVLLKNPPISIYNMFKINHYLLGEVLSLLWVNQPDSVKPKDNYVDLKAILKSTDDTIGSCLECNGPTTVMCQQCKTVLCEICFEKIHTGFVVFKSHVLKNIGITIKPNCCTVHTYKTADFYCTQCLRAVCVDCILLGGEKSCKNHSVVSAQEKNVEYLEELATIHPKVDETYKRLTKTAVDIGNILEKKSARTPDKETLGLIKIISSHYTKLHAVLQNQESEVLSKIDNLKLEEQNSLRKMKKELEENIKHSKTTLNKINKILTVKNPKVNLSGLLDTAKTVLDMPWFLSKCEDNDGTMKFHVDENVYKAIQDNIKFEYDTNVGYKLLASKDIGSDVEILPAPENAVFPPEFVQGEPTVDVTASLSSSSSSTSKSISSVVSKKPAKVMTSQTDEQQSSTSNTKIISDWLPPEPLSSSEFMGVPTHIDEEDVIIIYLHDTCQLDTLQLIANALQHRFKESDADAEPSHKWSVGDPCIALFYLDKKFYRCRVISINDKDRTCSLQYVDYGNEDTCSFRDMRKPCVLSQIPIQAHRCTLGRVKPASGQWADTALDYAHELLVDKKCKIKTTGANIGDLTSVDINVGKVNVSEHLVELDFAVLIDP